MILNMILMIVNQFFSKKTCSIFFKYSNIFISTAATSLYIFLNLSTGNSPQIALALIVFCGTFLVYHLQRLGHYFLFNELDDDFKIFYDTYSRYIYFFILLSLFTCIICFLFIAKREQIILLGCLFLSLIYVKIPFIKYSARSIPYIKPFFIALVWTLSTSFINKKTTFLNHLDVFIFITLLCMVFDIKDKAVDLNHSIKTFATQCEVKNFFLIYIGATLYSISFFFISKDIFYPIFLLIFLILTSLRNKNELVYYIGLDGLIILRFILYIF